VVKLPSRLATVANATISDAIARRIRELRKLRGGMTVAELAERCRAAGCQTLTTQAIYKLEGQRVSRAPRPVTVDELLILAYVLDVAPVHLIAGLGDEPVLVSPEWTVGATGARAWIRGQAPIEGGDRKAFEATVPDSEAHTYWFAVQDATSYEAVTLALDGLKAFVSLRQWQEEHQAAAAERASPEELAN
jgi:transcriptional regulator with XRE-family HTH domain